MAATLKGVILERLLSKYPDGDSPFFLKRRSEAHISVRLWVRRQRHEDGQDGGYANETYDVVVTNSGGGSENPDHLDVDITSETYRYVKYTLLAKKTWSKVA